MIGLDQLFSVEGKVALVTGGGRGIGLMMTEALVASGAKVYIASRKREVCEKVAAELGGGDRCIGLGADLSTEEGVVGLADELKRREDSCTSSSTIRVWPGVRRWKSSHGAPGTRYSD